MLIRFDKELLQNMNIFKQHFTLWGHMSVLLSIFLLDSTFLLDSNVYEAPVSTYFSF